MKLSLTRIDSAIVLAALVSLASVHAHAYDLSGVVRGPDGDAVGGATVWISQNRLVRVTVTDDEGRYSFPGIDVGPTELVAFKEGLSLGGRDMQVIDSAEIPLYLYEPDTIRLKVSDSAGKPLAGARITALHVGDRFSVPVEDLANFGFRSMRSGEDGTLVIDRLPKGSYTSFVVSHRRFASYALPTLPVGKELGIRLRYGVRLAGRITDAKGEGVARARVALSRMASVGQTKMAEALSGPEGYYNVMARPGRYHVVVRSRDHAIPPPQPIELLADPERDAVLNVSLAPPHILRGRSVDDSGKPVPATKFSFIAEGLIYAEAYSDGGGRFELLAPGGDGFLRVTPPRRFKTEQYPDIKLTSRAKELDVGEVTLLPLPEVRGRITVRDEAVRLDQVLITTVNYTPTLRTIANADGEFVFELDQMPEGGKIRFRAEHGLRLLRRDFGVDLIKERAVEERLKSFKVDLSPAPKWAPNKELGFLLDRPAPPWECSTWLNLADGDSLSLSDLAGKVIVVNFWGGFDNHPRGAGRDRINELRYLHRLYADVDDVAVVGIHAAGNTPTEIASFTANFGINFPVGCDVTPSITFDLYNVNQIPQTVLIDKQGKIAHYHVDGRLLELIKDLRRR
jgi:peroxiredoxin